MVAHPPERGDLVWVSFDPHVGHEQAGRRPALILSNAAYNRKFGMVMACPITSKVKGYPFEVPLPAGLPVRGVVLANHMRSLDWRHRPMEPIGATGPHVVEQVLHLVNVICE